MSISNYRKELKETCVGGEGLPDIIKDVPAIFDTLEKLIKDEDISSENRKVIFCAIGYFFIPDDLFPEETLGQIGYIDDIILALCVFEQVQADNLGRQSLQRSWCLEKDIDVLLNEELPKLKHDFRDEFIAVTEHIGLYPEYLADID
mgnify:CR=1 FL=1